MATVTNTIKLPGGITPTSAAVEIELVASTTAPAAGWVTATDVTIMARYRPAVTAGAWTADLTPNADIDPSGTVYRITEYADKAKVVNYIEVGSGGGTVHDLLVDAPGSLATAGSEAYTDAAIAALSALKAPVAAGIPTGGVAGQVVAKTSAADFATAWRSPTLLGPTFVALTDFHGEQFESWAWQMQIRSNGRFVLTQHTDSAVNDSTAALMSTIFDDYLSPTMPSFVILCLGFWDLESLTVAQYAANMATLVSAIQQAGPVVVLATIPPSQNSRPGGSTTSYKSKVAAASMWLRQFAALNGLPLIDFYSLLVDPANGALKSGYVGSGGSSFASVAAYKDMADLAVSTLAPYARPWSPVQVAFDTDPNNLIASPLSLPDANSDGIPDGWQTEFDGSGTVISIVSDARFAGGKAVEIAATTPTTARQFQTDNLNASGSAISAGDICAVTFSYSVESTDGLSTRPEVNGLSAYAAMPASMPFFAFHSQAPESGELLRFSGLLYFPVSGSPSGYYDRSTVRLMFKLEGINNGTRSMTVRVGDFGFFNLTKMGALTGFTTAAGSWNWVNSYRPSDYWPVGS